MEVTKMSRRFYAIQHGYDFSSDTGSTVKREALKIARFYAKQYPEEEIRVVYCRVDDDFAEDVIIFREGEIL